MISFAGPIVASPADKSRGCESALKHLGQPGSDEELTAQQGKRIRRFVRRLEQTKPDAENREAYIVARSISHLIQHHYDYPSKTKLDLISFAIEHSHSLSGRRAGFAHFLMDEALSAENDSFKQALQELLAKLSFSELSEFLALESSRRSLSVEEFQAWHLLILEQLRLRSSLLSSEHAIDEWFDLAFEAYHVLFFQRMVLVDNREHELRKRIESFERLVGNAETLSFGGAVKNRSLSQLQNDLASLEFYISSDHESNEYSDLVQKTHEFIKAQEMISALSEEFMRVVQQVSAWSQTPFHQFQVLRIAMKQLASIQSGIAEARLSAIEAKASKTAEEKAKYAGEAVEALDFSSSWTSWVAALVAQIFQTHSPAQRVILMSALQEWLKTLDELNDVIDSIHSIAGQDYLAASLIEEQLDELDHGLGLWLIRNMKSPETFEGWAELSAVWATLRWNLDVQDLPYDLDQMFRQRHPQGAAHLIASLEDVEFLVNALGWAGSQKTALPENVIIRNQVHRLISDLEKEDGLEEGLEKAAQQLHFIFKMHYQAALEAERSLHEKELSRLQYWVLLSKVRRFESWRKNLLRLLAELSKDHPDVLIGGLRGQIEGLKINSPLVLLLARAYTPHQAMHIHGIINRLKNDAGLDVLSLPRERLEMIAGAKNWQGVGVALQREAQNRARELRKKARKKHP